MDTIRVNRGKTKMIAHRGLSGIEKENTLSAFVAAANRSYWGIETDIHKTKDGKFVIIHDETTGRVSDADINVEESTYDEVRRVILNDTDGLARADLVIPDLCEYIRVCKKYEKIAVLELKNRFLKEDIVRIVGIIEEMGYLENMVFISFNFDNLVDLRSILPDAAIQFLTKEYSDELVEKLKEYSFDLDIWYKALDKETVAKIKASGIALNCWTVNEKEVADWLIDAGIDYITTNIIE